MIQRIQTLLLILLIGCNISTFYFPLWQKIEFDLENKNQASKIVTGYIYEIVNDDLTTNETILIRSFHINILLVISILLAIYSIFKYNNRLTQIKIGTLNSILLSGIIFSVLYDVFYNIKFIEINDQTSFLFSFYLIFLAMFLNFLSNRFIRKDELLVSKSNRIR